MRRLAWAFTAGMVTVLAVLASNLLAGRGTSPSDTRAALLAVAWSGHVATAVTQYLDERRHDLELLAALPDIVHASRAAAADAKRRGLQKRGVAALEREQDAARALSRDPRVAATLASWRETFGFAELSFSERDGYAVLGTERTPDFVQSDEDWWQRAFADGYAETVPQYDPSGAVTIELAVRITDPATRAPMGVVKGTLPLASLAPFTRMGAPLGTSVEIIDAARRIIVSPDTSRLLREVPESLPPLASQATHREMENPQGITIAAAAPTHGARWWVITRAHAAVPDGPGSSEALYEDAALAGGVVLVMVWLALGLAGLSPTGAERSRPPGSLPS